jgi:hypothetical protein
MGDLGWAMDGQEHHPAESGQLDHMVPLFAHLNQVQVD